MLRVWRFLFALPFSIWALAEPTGVATDTSILLIPHPGTEIATRDRSFRCSVPEGCHWEPVWIASGSDARQILELTASPLESGKLEFVRWELSVDGEPNDEMPPYRTLIYPESRLDVGRREFRTYFSKSRMLRSQDELFQVGFSTAPDFWSNSFEMDIPACMDTTWYDQEQRDYRWRNGRIELNHRTKVAAFDVTADGLKDLVMYASCGPLNHDIGIGSEAAGYLIVLKQTTDGQFVFANKELFGRSEVEVGRYVGGQRFHSIEDFNNDGRFDFVLSPDRDGGNDGVAAGLWQSALATEDPYPSQDKGGWESTDYIALSQAGGMYEVAPLAHWSFIMPAYREADSVWTLMNESKLCADLMDVIPPASEWECTQPMAVNVDGANLIDVSDSVFSSEPLEDTPNAPRWVFKSGMKGLAHLTTLKHHHNFVRGERHLTTSAGETIALSSRPGGGKFGEPYFRASVSRGRGPQQLGTIIENEHFKTFSYGKEKWAGLTIYGEHYVRGFHEGYHLFKSDPDASPIILADIYAYRLAYFNQEELDTWEGFPSSLYCTTDLDLNILGIPEGTSQEECYARDDVWYGDRFYLALRLREDGNLEAVPIEENPTFDDRYDWLTQSHQSNYMRNGHQIGSHVAHFYATPFQDVNGDGYEDYIEFNDAFQGNVLSDPDGLCAEAEQTAWGPNITKTSCRFTALMINDKSGKLRRVTLDGSSIPYERGTSWQYYADLNDDGLVDIVNMASFSLVKDIHNVIELGVHYGKSRNEDEPSDASPLVRFIELLMSVTDVDSGSLAGQRREDLSSERARGQYEDSDGVSQHQAKQIPTLPTLLFAMLCCAVCLLGCRTLVSE